MGPGLYVRVNLASWTMILAQRIVQSRLPNRLCVSVCLDITSHTFNLNRSWTHQILGRLLPAITLALHPSYSTTYASAPFPNTKCGFLSAKSSTVCANTLFAHANQLLV